MLKRAAVLPELLGGPAWGALPVGLDLGLSAAMLLAAGHRLSSRWDRGACGCPGLVGQLALNEIIMDKYMKRLAQVSCLFIIDGPKCFVCAVTCWFCHVWGRTFCRTNSNPWFLWLTMISETWFEAVWSVGMDFECCGDRWDFKICWKRSV